MTSENLEMLMITGSRYRLGAIGLALGVAPLTSSAAYNPVPARTVLLLLSTTGADEGSILLFFLVLAGVVASVLIILGLLILSSPGSKQ